MTASKLSVPTAEAIRSWPVTVDVPTAGMCFGLGRDTSYDLARLGQFPTPVLRLGRSLRVTRAALLLALGMQESTIVAPGSDLASGSYSQVRGSASDHRSDARAYSEVSR
jgi:hypothetical protein